MSINCPFCNSCCSIARGSLDTHNFCYVECNNTNCLIDKTPRFECQFEKANPQNIVYYDVFDIENGFYYSLTYNILYKATYGHSCILRIHEINSQDYILEDILTDSVDYKNSRQILDKYKTRFKKILAFI